MPTRRSHPYSIRRRSRAGAARRDRLREAAANWTAGDDDAARDGAGDEVHDPATAKGPTARGLNIFEVTVAPGGTSLSRTPEPRARHVPPPGARRRDGHSPAVTFHPNRETVEAIMKAAAIVACADGQVSSLERLSLMSFLGRHGILAREGRAASAAAFDRAVQEAAALRLDEACAAADSLRHIAGRPGASMVAHAATVVALADGIGWPQKIALLEVIRDRLGLRAGHQTRSAMSDT